MKGRNMKLRNLGILWIIAGIISGILGIIGTSIQMIFMSGMGIGVGIIVLLFSATKEAIEALVQKNGKNKKSVKKRRQKYE